MKARNSEHIGKPRVYTPRVGFGWLKRQTSKKWRRAAKASPEDAPVKRPVRGWAD